MVDVCDGSMGWPVGQAVGKGGEGAIVILTDFFGLRARARGVHLRRESF